MMVDILMAGVYVAILFGVGFAAGGVYVQARKRHQAEADSVLMIKPPRRYLDDDGRSDFRPELRERAERRRAQEAATR